MYAMGKLSDWVYTVSGPFHPFGGAVDIIVVQQPDGSYKSSPWYVRFGKFQGVLKTKEKVVTICVNGEKAKFHMYLDHKGEAYFLKDWDFDDSGDSEISSHSSGDEVDENDSNLKFKKEQSCNFDGVKTEQIVSVKNEQEKIVDVENGNGKFVTMENGSGKIVTMENGNGKFVNTEEVNGTIEYTENGNGKMLNRTRSKRAMLYQLMFGSKQTNGSIKITNVDTVVENEITPNKVENVNNESLKSELASTDVDDNFNKSVTTGKGFDDLNPYSNGNCNIEELNDSHKEKAENSADNLDSVLENDDGQVKSVIHAETSEASSTCTERDGNICSTLLTESDTVIQSCVENGVNILKPSSSEITCITHDMGSNSLQNGSNDVTTRNVGSCEPAVICQGQETTEFSKEVGGTDTVDFAHGNSMETSENGIRIQIPESLDDVQFQFSNEQSSVTGAETTDNYSNFLNEDVDKSELEDRSNEECSSSMLTASVNCTSPMDIPKSRSNFEETHQLLTKSLPIIRSEIHDLGRTNDLHPLSSSLKFNGEMSASDSSCLSINANSVTDLGNKEVDSSAINSFDESTKSKQSLEHQDIVSTDKDMGNCNGTSESIVQNDASWRLWLFGMRKSKTINATHPVSESITQENIVKSPMRSQSLASEDELERAKLTKKKVSLAPTSEELASLNLNEGSNTITFSFSTSMLGQQQVDARIFLWKWNTRIVISDVDGTITKSDVLGQFMPLVGKDWSQTGVAHLFSAIKENGYEFIFLSARSISQAYLTRQFLMNLKQDGKALPDGPVVISPDGLFPSLYREVIRRAPHEFKISCLEEIKALFPTECNPFYAGFGNRDTDEFSYLKVGIPKGKIFIINPKGEVVVNRRVHDSGSYTSLHALVDGMFPPATAEVEEYNPWNFWKLPTPDIDI